MSQIGRGCRACNASQNCGSGYSYFAQAGDHGGWQAHHDDRSPARERPGTTLPLPFIAALADVEQARGDPGVLVPDLGQADMVATHAANCSRSLPARRPRWPGTGPMASRAWLGCATTPSVAPLSGPGCIRRHPPASGILGSSSSTRRYDSAGHQQNSHRTTSLR